MLYRMRWRAAFLILGTAMLVAGAVRWSPWASAQGAVPLSPVIYSGTATVGGSPAPDGLQIVGRILDYESPSVVTSDGEYRNLTVAPPNNYQFQNLTFHILVHELKAEEEVMNLPGGLAFPTLHLTFPALPPPTPTPTPTPTVTPTPTRTPTPTPTPTPLPRSEETTTTVDTTSQASVAELDNLGQAVVAILGVGVQTTDAPIEVTSTDQGLAVALPVTGVTVGQEIVGELNVTLGNLTLEITDGEGTATIVLGPNLSVEGQATLVVTNPGLAVVIEDPQLVFEPEAPDAKALAGGSESVSNIGVDFQVNLSNLPDGASLSVQYAKDPTVFVDRPGVTFQLAAQEVGGVLEDPNEDIAFLVGVTKTGITNEDLSDNSTTMTVSKAWYDQKLAEGKDIFITKIDEEGNFFTQAATCVVTGATVTCTVKFSDDAGGFSEFVLISVVRPETPTTAQADPHSGGRHTRTDRHTRAAHRYAHTNGRSPASCGAHGNPHSGRAVRWARRWYHRWHHRSGAGWDRGGHSRLPRGNPAPDGDTGLISSFVPG